MTTVETYINSVLYTTRRIDIWRESLAGVGRFEVLLENQDNAYGGLISPEDSVELKINNISMMRGYVDDVLPNISDASAVYRNLLKIKGRDYGQDLASLYIKAKYFETSGAGLHWDDIIYDALIRAYTEINYTSASAGDPLTYEFKNSYLLDGLSEMAKLAGFDFWVEDDKTLKAYLLADVPDSGVVIESQPALGANPNSILDVKEIGENVGFDIRNYVRVYANNIDDHWTEGNASWWETMSVPTEVIEDDYATCLAGKASIRCKVATAAQYRYHKMRLPMTTLTTGAPYIDLTETSDTIHYLARHNVDREAFDAWRLELEDSNGNVIQWSDFDNTDEIPQNIWRKIKDIPIGSDQTIHATDPQPSAGWYYAYGNSFNWMYVVAVRFTNKANAIHNNQFHWTDGLYIPIEAQAIREDGLSQGSYRKRMINISRNDLKSQIQLNSMAVAELAHRKDPTKKLNLTATFQSDAKYAGYTLGVNLPSNGIGGYGPRDAVVYRILGLHHAVEPDMDMIRGHDAITEFDLVKADATTVDPLRLRLSQNPTLVQAQRAIQRLNAMEQGR